MPSSPGTRVRHIGKSQCGTQTTQVARERSGNVPCARAQELHHGRRRAPNPLLWCGDQAQGRMGDSVSAISSIVFRSLSSRLDIVSGDEPRRVVKLRGSEDELTYLSIKLFRRHHADREPRKGRPRRHVAYTRVEHEPRRRAAGAGEGPQHFSSSNRCRQAVSIWSLLSCRSLPGGFFITL